MSHWVTIYLKESPPKLTIKDLQTSISDADWWTLGEDFDIEEEAVDAFMDEITWKEDPISVGLPKERPLVIHFWQDPARVAEELGEVREREGVPQAVLEHLGLVKTVVGIEMGLCHFQNMHEVLAFEIAYALAEKYSGLICDAHENWFDHDEHRWEPFV